ncbi:hypothetical protein [Streptomyces sp. NPDC018693]|uniref:hypothetical protein n=1 Tax=unclassified Streptomyces TaxID=2593676 RepID=UPI0037B7963D
MSFGPPPSVHTQSTLAAENRRKQRRTARLLAAAAVLLVAALGAGTWLMRGGDGGPEPDRKPQPAAQSRLDIRETVEQRPASTTGAMAFRYSTDTMSPGEHVEMPGMWATDRILAKGVNRTLVGCAIGSDASPGEQDERWKLRLGGPICGYTRA